MLRPGIAGRSDDTSGRGGVRRCGGAFDPAGLRAEALDGLPPVPVVAGTEREAQVLPGGVQPEVDGVPGPVPEAAQAGLVTFDRQF
ncbi:hypothetical protein [Kitasatospora sp. CB01950]|uniref:hypothetical protein n=1 Tax=Kitasatospora sp. CB01950 TaxID=1703930 RepID=UPI001160FA9A|nr:hypothetical protein [Kitasatospora sp. CB01950]